MGETINKLIKFISEDPIMLGLCFAIVALIIIFILVLIFGGKKEKKQAKVEEAAIDNTQALLKTTLNDEPLKSTQEFSFASNNEQPVLNNTQSLENIQILSEIPAEEDAAPISVNEAMELKNQREMEALKNTIEVPVLEQTDNNIAQEMTIEPTNNIEPSPTPIQEGKPLEVIEQPLSPVYTSEENMPEMEIPVVPKNNDEVAKSAEDDIDIDLPKLKTEPSSSIFDTLSGETFNIDNK